MEAGQVAAVIGDEMAPVGGRPAAHAVNAVQDLPEAARLGGGVRQGDGRLQRGLEDVGRDDLPALELAAVHQGDEPVRHVLDAGDDGAARGHAVDVLVVRDLVELEGVALLGERHAGLRLLDHLGDREGRVGHLQRAEDPFPDEILPALAGLELDHVPDGGVHQVVVEEGLAQGRAGLEELGPVEQLLAREVGLVPDRIVARDAGPVGQHVAEGDRVVEQVVVERDGRDGRPDRLVPGQLAFVDQHAGGDGREQLGVRGDLMERRRGIGQLLAVVAVAVALGEDELVADDDADADPGGVPVLEDLGHVGVEVAELLDDILARGLGQEPGRREEEEERGKKQGGNSHAFHRGTSVP